MDSLSESRGGINSAPSSGSIPRNMNQVHNLSKFKVKSSTQTMTSDPYLDLIIKCKEQCKSEGNIYSKSNLCSRAYCCTLH